MKYHSKKIYIGDLKFDSKKEANRYLELKSMLDKGEISELELQVPFILIEPFTLNKKKYRKTEYICDFYYKQNGKEIVEDVKSKATRTPLYMLKKKLMAYIYKIEIKEV